ncbi:M28 family peptidase [Pedobacter sp. MR2016-19]|uniref:M28 family peptidase n=1 Tax=Pedobacter sp. MR2016-19 TaxID=2780089 RepID=UPI0018765A97|nr:M28 family peptidase [Pedobacter sp. MR2016-19]MBE5321790.1 M28 family peptidase [Pedobacter sp. MR2016-19]
MKTKILFALLFAGVACYAQNPTDEYFKLTRAGFIEKNAYETTAFVEKYFRVPGNTGFNASIHYVENILKKAGFVEQKQNEFEAPLTYRIEKRTMKNSTWEPVDANIDIVGEAQPLISYKTNRNMIPINCSSTPPDGITANVVYIEKIAPAEIEKMDLKGKIMFSENNPSRLLQIATKVGAIGVLGYSMPKYTQPELHQTSIQFGSMKANSEVWTLLLSYAAKEKLKSACLKGETKLKVNIQTKIYPSEELTIVANVRGSVSPTERFVFSAHVQEPGANDNASGVGTLAEMARLTAELYQTKKINPKRSLTFLWGDEIVSTRRYITEDTTRAKGIMWGMSLDMVGEDTQKTGGSFLIEKMPDPSAIWTRGKDKHTEWGAGDVSEKDLFPHYFNDFIFDICKAQGKYANWTVNYNPFEGGSDHTPFLQNKIPGLLMWHFTDVFYHTDNDRIDKVSPTEMKNVGISGLTAAYTLISADENTVIATVSQVKADALTRLKTEFELSKKAIADGKAANDEKHIIEVWCKWYVDALATINKMPVKAETTKVGSSIKFATNEIEKQTKVYLAELK